MPRSGFNGLSTQGHLVSVNNLGNGFSSAVPSNGLSYSSSIKPFGHTLVSYDSGMVPGSFNTSHGGYNFQHSNLLSQLSIPNSEAFMPLNPTANVAFSFTIHDPNWYLDSGATNHVTSSGNNLSTQTDYNGTNKLVVGNGEGLEITSIGNTSLSSSTCNLQLRDVLVVPRIANN